MSDSKHDDSKITVEPYMQNRELSWLEFNRRVLDQGADDTVPLLDRLSFISIFWSNLKEFFMVRVGSLTDLSLLKKAIIDLKSGMTPSEQLDAIYKRCHELYPYYQECFENLRKLLSNEGIKNLKPSELDEDQRTFVGEYFHSNVMPFLSPQIINARHPFPHLENGALYIVVRLDEEAERKKKEGKKGSKNVGAKGVTLGIIPLPAQCDRMVQLPGKGCQFILLENLIEMYATDVFSMYKVKHTNIICVTRNADLDATEGTEEQGEDYREHMKRILKKRSRLAPVRLECEKELSNTVRRALLERLNLKNHQIFVLSMPLDMSYVYDIADRISEKKRGELLAAPFTPVWPACLDRNRSVINQVCEREVLLSYPYESMDAFDMLLREAAVDPAVISIKITLYRLAKQSRMAEALIAAAENGKEVTAIFELRARFDESNNIDWSQRFEQAGCHVLYGFRNYKVHSKICCITRQTPDGLQHITQIGTGNYNEKTAALYTDFSFITADQSIGRDATAFFRNLALENTSDEYDILWVAPLQIKQNILAGIDEQIERQRQGLPSGLFFKTNSITDKEIIDKIVEASQAGVKCTLLVRGISCIVPGLADYTANVCVVSIVGRLLEHSRIYCFGPLDGDDVKVYLSSADLMTRNMDKRIEVAWPILNNELRDQVIGYIGTCMADTAKLRDLMPNKEYTPLRFFAKEDAETGHLDLFDSQAFLIREAQRRHLEAAELTASRNANRSAAIRETDIAMDEPVIPALEERDLDTYGEETSELVEAPIEAPVDRVAQNFDAPVEVFSTTEAHEFISSTNTENTIIQESPEYLEAPSMVESMTDIEDPLPLTEVPAAIGAAFAGETQTESEAMISGYEMPAEPISSSNNEASEAIPNIAISDYALQSNEQHEAIPRIATLNDALSNNTIPNDVAPHAIDVVATSSESALTEPIPVTIPDVDEDTGMPVQAPSISGEFFKTAQEDNTIVIPEKKGFFARFRNK